jgi:predicted nucleic acid-binding protein
MIIVSNTSPLNYLILIGHINLLPELFQQIIIPQAVYLKGGLTFPPG